MRKFLLSSEKLIGVPLVLFLFCVPLFFNAFQVNLMGKFIIFALLAISLDLVWGYAGLLSIGHAVFFGLGGYIIALSYTFQNGTPSFMKRFGIEEIPVFMQPLTNIPTAFILGLIIPAVVAALVGFFILKSRVTGVYFSLITLIMAALFQMIVINLQAYTGGFNGLMGLPRLPLFGKPFSLTTFYYIVLFVTIAVYFFAKALTRSHFGKVLMSIRENEERTGFLGYDVSNYKIVIFTISGLIAGLAGMLYVSMNGFVGPSDVGIALSMSVILWVAIGGRGTLMGAVVGAIGINYLSNSLSESFPEIWYLLVGIVMVLVVMFLPDGVYGSFKKWLESRNASA